MPAEDRQKMAIGLTCTDMQASVKFYRDQLGFEMKESWPSPDQPMWANMLLHGQSVMLGGAMEPDKVGEMCGGDAAKEAHWRGEAERFRSNAAGVGVQIYLMVEDVDAYHTETTGNGVEAISPPETQFYGIREYRAFDPDGYQLVFFTPVAMSECQSCGMPLADTEPGQMYCGHCTDDAGKLRSYEQVFEGTVTGYFMGMQSMDRGSAESAAREHLAKMPAWAAHGA